MLRAVAVVLGVLVLASCGGGSDVLGEQPEPSAGGSSSSARAASLAGVEWQLQSVTQDGRERAMAEFDAVLRFDGKGKMSGQGCNHFGGTVKITGDHVKASDISSTLMACMGPRNELDSLMTKPLTDGARWAVSDGQLTITSGATTLVFRERDTVFPTRDMTPLVQGEIGSAVYRLGYRADAGQVGVDWESRDEPGNGFGSTGVSRPVDFDVTYLEPSAAAVAGRAFVFVVGPLDVGRMTFEPAGGGAPVELRAYDIPAAKTWRIYAGFVGSRSKDGVVVAYGSDGKELMRSRPLPM